MAEGPKWTDIAIVILTIGIVFFALMQWLEMRGSGQQTDKLLAYAKVQANAASDIGDAAQQFSDTAEETNNGISEAVDQLKAAASNAKASIRATQDAMRLDQRAWVVTKGVGPPPEIDKPWELRVVFTNSGKTPAKTVEISCTVEPAASERTVSWRVPPHENPTMLSPNEEKFCTLRPIVGGGKITKDALDYLALPTSHLYVYGSVVYQDVFRRWHWLTFCNVMQADGKNWDSCTKGNDTGEGKIPPPPFDKGIKVEHQSVKPN